MAASATRGPIHAGSWYTGDPKQLREQLQSWLRQAPEQAGVARGFICPHAGYRYSGLPAAHGYKGIAEDPAKKPQRFFVLGPSHHVGFSGCRLSSFDVMGTPLGDIAVDKTVVSELKNSGMFKTLQVDTDEEEHSLEMQFPFLKHLAPDATVVPIMVGQIGEEDARQYGAVLSRYMDDPSTSIVVSSDFCHWGRRFGYTYLNDEWAGGPQNAYKSIEKLDRLAMDAIESGDPSRFQSYIDKYQNTICGRRAISIMMHALNRTTTKLEPKFVHYAQSSRAQDTNDSSVSYAVAQIVPK
eukprot:TRINITY_DN4681_c0_g1_i1.p2 TRINITY_DN4681_c0_g1~~TRINITY_DN4681_c0_g1_i1.p2  ORF type:complete len:297 (-),score=72.28 TRINITY_DN4681_c0_g1_i1:1107-1997(-)